MGTFREEKRAARQQLHTALAEPALYLASLTDEPVEVTVRLHLNFTALGDLLATRVGFGERQEMAPRIIFMNAQIDPKRDARVITKDMGAFYIDNALEPDDITTSVEVAPILKETAARYGWDVSLPWCGFPAPEGV